MSIIAGYPPVSCARLNVCRFIHYGSNAPELAPGIFTFLLLPATHELLIRRMEYGTFTTLSS